MSDHESVAREDWLTKRDQMTNQPPAPLRATTPGDPKNETTAVSVGAPTFQGNSTTNALPMQCSGGTHIFWGMADRCSCGASRRAPADVLGVHGVRVDLNVPHPTPAPSAPLRDVSASPPFAYALVTNTGGVSEHVDFLLDLTTSHEAREHLDREHGEEAPHRVVPLYTAIPDEPMRGDWRCPKCFFVQSYRTLNAHSGAVGVVSIADDPRCPNDGTALVTMTWRDFAKDLMQMIDQRDKEIAELRDALSRSPSIPALAERLRESAERLRNFRIEDALCRGEARELHAIATELENLP